jgi:hypothetical protein
VSGSKGGGGSGVTGEEVTEEVACGSGAWEGGLK